MANSLKELQRRLQHEFSNPALLTRALTHRSFSADHYERLEFLGDSVLGLAISGLLYVSAYCPAGAAVGTRMVRAAPPPPP